MPRAHPIGGWKGFEDVLEAIPGATVDLRQRNEGDLRMDPPGEAPISRLFLDSPLTSKALISPTCFGNADYNRCSQRPNSHDGGLLPRGMHLHRDIRTAVDVKTD